MQNLPTKTDLGHAVKKIFIASEGCVLMSLDYSQIDLRAAAILSGDKRLLNIFENNIDVHLGVAAQVLHKKESEVTTEERRKAKAINFGILYGMGVSALKEAMNAERVEAQVFYDTYKETFSELMTYLESVKSSAIKTGLTHTLLGRPRYIPMIQSHIPFIRAQGERMAINAPIQGTSADIIKLGMIDVYNDTELAPYFKNGSLKMQLQIHDELVFEVKTDAVEKVGARISYILTQVLEKRKSNITQKLVPLNVSLGTGKNMAEVK
jgi:DNA polymerase-1